MFQFHFPCCGKFSLYFTSDASEEYFQLGIKHPNQPTLESNALQDLTCCNFRVPTCCWKDSVPVEAAIDLTISVKLQNCSVYHPSKEFLSC